MDSAAWGGREWSRGCDAAVTGAQGRHYSYLYLYLARKLINTLLKPSINPLHAFF
jgi:hypothetical protein